MKNLTSALIAAGLLAVSAPVAGQVAEAAPALALVGDKTLVMFDTDNPSVSKSMDVDGVDSLLGIDLRPSNRTLIGVTDDHHIVEINPATGEAMMKSKMDTMLPVDGGPVIVDFNPAADKLRFMTGTTNHRVDVDSGKVTVDGSLAFESKDMHAGEAPDIVAAAYINSYGKPDKTAMYDIDKTIVALIQQTSPNDGTLGAIGKLGINNPGEYYAFDVQTTADMTNTGWLVTDNILYTVDMKTGKATAKGAINGVEGEVRDLTVLTLD